MRYINQRDYPEMLYITRTDPDNPGHERGKKTTIKASGCGLCSAIMVADRLLPAYEFELEDAIALSYETGANHSAGTDYKLFAPAFAEKMGLKLETSKNLADLRRCLRTGGAAVLLVGGDREGHIGLFTHGGHYMMAFGEEPDGRFAILDPSYYVGKFEEEGRQGKVELKNGIIVLCDGDTLEEETKEKATPYYLFWRK